MIVRILEGTVVHGAEATFAEVARRRLPAFREVAGVRSIHLARRITPSGLVEFAWVSIWEDAAALADFETRSGDPPAFIRELGPIVASWQLRHLEAFDDEPGERG